MNSSFPTFNLPILSLAESTLDLLCVLLFYLSAVGFFFSFYILLTYTVVPLLFEGHMFQDFQCMPETSDSTEPDCHQSEHVSLHTFHPQILCLLILTKHSSYTVAITFAV